MAETFAELSATFVDEYFALHPIRATDAGAHAHDGRWPDVTEAGRAARLAFYDRWVADLAGLPDDSLTADERIDRDLVIAQLEAHRFGESVLLEDAWDAVSWAYLLGDALFPLLVREFAPLAVRLASITERLEGLPTVVDGAIAALVGTGDRAVPRLHTETALEQLPGVRGLAGEAVGEAEVQAADDPAIAALLPRLRAAADGATRAIERLEQHLREVVLPTSSGDGLLGSELFETKLRHTLNDPTATTAAILARAEREAVAVRAEMVRLARDLWPVWRPGEPMPTAAPGGDQAAAEQLLVRSVLDAIAQEHPAGGDLLDDCRAELARIEAFCREHDVVGLADEPLEIRWTPAFLRAFGGAMLIPPGPLDRGQKSFLAITPIPDDWSAEQAESWLREQNDRQLRLLTIHEAVPGHYLQLAYANRVSSPIRAIFWSGVFAEGWAVYVTQVMLDLGYGAEDPALALVHWKFYLRAVLNAILDVRIHTLGMSTEEAVGLMVDGGFQEEAEARNKDKRARLSSTQLSTYFVGSLGCWDIELERRRRLAGDPSIAPRALPGGLGPTPGFEYREHLETVMAHGSPPLAILRRILFD